MIHGLSAWTRVWYLHLVYVGTCGIVPVLEQLKSGDVLQAYATRGEYVRTNLTPADTFEPQMFLLASATIANYIALWSKTML